MRTRRASWTTVCLVAVLACGQPAPSTSNATATWGPVPLTVGEGSSASDIGFASGLFVLAAGVRDRAVVYRSSDGVNWQLSPPVEDSDATEAVAVVAGNDAWVMLVTERGGGAARPGIRRSTDGATWDRRVELDVVRDTVSTALTWTGSRYLAFANQPQPGDDMLQRAVIYRSADGIAWDEVFDPALDDGSDVMAAATAGHGVVVAAGNDRALVGALLVSQDDGISWKRIRPESLIGARITSIVATPEGWLLGGCRRSAPAGDERATIWRSDGGFDGPYRVVNVEPVNVSCIEDLALAPPGVVAAGTAADRGAIWGSLDGESWNPEGSVDGFAGGPRSTLNAIAFGSPLLVAVGHDAGPPLDPTESLRIWLSER